MDKMSSLIIDNKHFQEGLIVGVSKLGEKVLEGLQENHGWTEEAAEKFLKDIIAKEDFFFYLGE